MKSANPSAIELSVILPSYQEEENLRFLLPRINQALASINVSYEILVIGTIAPLDNSEIVSISNGAKYIRRLNGNNYGDAVRTGILNAEGDFIVFMDSDGSHPPEMIQELYQHKNNYDVIIASRYVESGYTENSLLLVLMSRLLNITYSVFLGLRCKDISNSLRLYVAKDLKRVSLQCNNFDIVEEILIKLYRSNKSIRILEIPFTFKQRMFGKSKRNLIIFMFTYIFTLIKLRFFI